MTFTTIQFAIFMAVLFISYYVIPKKFQWMVLLSGNMVFYCFAGIKSLVFLLCVMLFTYLFGILVAKSEKRKGLLLFFCVSVIICIMCIMRMGFSSYIKPLGLSYYALMCLSYVVNVYWGMSKAEYNPLKLMLYISYFPHVIQGPFDDVNELKDSFFKEHNFDYDYSCRCIIRIGYGLMKKLVLADRIGNIVANVFNSPSDYYGLTVVMCVVLYAFELYADFSGYMDIAVGCSGLFGIKIKENFNVPFLAKSMEEFWRRWHMSLGIWFKNYVFYGVQRWKICGLIRSAMKKRKNKYLMKTLPTVIGLTVVWTLIGLWHGFDPNYLLYDWTCGVIIILSEILVPVYAAINNKNKRISGSGLMNALRVIRTFILVALTFVIFRASTVSDAFLIIRNMFTSSGISKACEYIYWNVYDFFLITPAFIVLIVVDILKYRNVDITEKIKKINPVCRYCIYIIGLLYIYIARHNGETVGFAYSIF